jgi:hypothetical protein
MRIRVLALAAALCASAAAAAQEPPSHFNGELGLRYWYSTGITRHSHSAQRAFPDLGNPTSVLTYDNLDAHVAEIHGRQSIGDRWFLKGIVGVGRIITGSFRDEDYFAGQEKFSDTTSSVPEGWLWHFTADVGRHQWVLGERAHSVAVFVGYAQWTEYVDAYGATFTVDTLGDGSPIDRGTKVISNKVIWRALRLGVGADVALTQRTRLAAEIAFVPYGTVRNEDSHHLRTDPNDLGPAPNIVITGHGRGFQLEGELRHEIVRRVDLSLGWRYWYLRATHGERTLPNDPTFPALPLVELYSKRFGATLTLTRRW